MKNFAIKLAWFTTIYVFAFVVLCQTKLLISIIMGMYLFGLCLVLFLIYTVLHDAYKTSKTFKDWYEDCPNKRSDE
ncbi:hypothetical protein [Flavobacterium laiguense]|uniref:Uncharacterized protein n=1 Tax=Flavobacterium laiguense TaxID=2169409 RepID=A0A2U1JS43_9FLAO|nr:hypothetical protein [Flavobacterium laiguense]PWA07779.1 hypothetical protein DB891_14055 [Flavobacterium laiguense]